LRRSGKRKWRRRRRRNKITRSHKAIRGGFSQKLKKEVELLKSSLNEAIQEKEKLKKQLIDQETGKKLKESEEESNQFRMISIIWLYNC